MKCCWRDRPDEALAAFERSDDMWPDRYITLPCTVRAGSVALVPYPESGVVACRSGLPGAGNGQAERSKAFYRQVANVMDLANHDPVGAEKRVYELTGRHPIDAVHMISMAIESLGKFH